MPEARVRSHDSRWACGLVAVAFVLRLLWGLGAGVTPGGAEFDDAAWYHQTAITLAHGGGYASPFTGRPTAAWPPGYPVVLALAYRIAGPTPAAAVALNAVAGALTCFLVWRLGTHLAGRRAGLVATALAAFFPSAIFFTALVLSETLFTCLVCGLALAAVRMLGRGDASPVHWIAWGLAVGATTLVRAESTLLAIVPATSLALRGDRRAVRVLAATVVGVALTLTPWTLRNARVFGTFVPTSTGFGRTLWIGHNPDATGGMSEAIQRAMEQALATAGIAATDEHGEIAVDRLLRAQAIAYARTHPLREVALTPLRAYHLFRGDHVWQRWYDPGTPRAMPGARGLLGVVGNVYYAAVFALAIVGFAGRRAAPAASWRFVDVLVTMWIALFAVVYGDPRFHQVLAPFACVLAAVTIVTTWNRHDAVELDAARAT